MLIKQVIINSSPLIALFKSQQADLLLLLFTDILVPEGVWNEVWQKVKMMYHLNSYLLARQAENDVLNFLV